ncbi:putative transposase subunit [Alteromonas mediterranea U4]|nr:putative transposase subunit [Alteromonas mediterranea U4]AGP94525.1 putative transposase subunit [Alteromonas mediterranea U8]
MRCFRLGQLLNKMNIGHVYGSYQKKLAQLAKNKLLILDEWGMEKLSARQVDDLFDVMKERYKKTSIIIVSQFPVTEWCKLIGNPTVADA